jgi:hypothetical protein
MFFRPFFWSRLAGAPHFYPDRGAALYKVTSLHD